MNHLKFILSISRLVIALAIIMLGIYMLQQSAFEWYKSGLKVLSYGGSGKNPFHGVIFSCGFILYGGWEIYNILTSKKT